MDARSEWISLLITGVVQTCEAADKEVVTRGSEAAGVADMGRVEALEVEEDTTPKISSSIHKAVALVINRPVIRSPDHKASHRIQPKSRPFVAFTIG